VSPPSQNDSTSEAAEANAIINHEQQQQGLQQQQIDDALRRVAALKDLLPLGAAYLGPRNRKRMPAPAPATTSDLKSKKTKRNKLRPGQQQLLTV